MFAVLPANTNVMKAKLKATVVCLNQDLVGVTDAAVALLNSVTTQDHFAFTFDGAMTALPETSEPARRAESELEAFLVAEKNRHGCDHLIAILDEPLENNWFSNTAYSHHEIKTLADALAKMPGLKNVK